MYGRQGQRRMNATTDEGSSNHSPPGGTDQEVAHQPPPLPPPPSSPAYTTVEAMDALYQKVANLEGLLTQLQQLQEEIKVNSQRFLSSQQPPNSHQPHNSQHIPNNEDDRHETNNLNNRKHVLEPSAHKNFLPPPKRTRVDDEFRLPKERLEEIEKGKRKESPTDIGLKVSPFTREILKTPLPKDFHLPELDRFDGTTDPWEHVTRYHYIMQLYSFNDAIQCRAFPTTLTKAAWDWFHKIPPDSIFKFSQFANMFTQKFIVLRERKKNSLHLMSLKQGPNESLRKFIKRFKEGILEIDDISVDFVVTAFYKGTRCKKLKESLYIRPPKTLDDLMTRVYSFINLEDVFPHVR